MAVSPRRLVHYLRQLTGPHATAPDADLLGRFLHGRDESAFADLVARHGPMVRHVCRRVLADVHAADDAFQATFLVLARKASTVRPPQALAGWLHGVAYRVALKARVSRARRLARETTAADLAPPDLHPDPLQALSVRELFNAVDEEVRRLPAAYRLPVILCCLEGKTQEETARQLGWTPGSVKGRLERGRKRLHERLTRRGLSLAAALAAAEVSRGLAAEATEAALWAATVKGALAFSASGGACSPGVPARAAELAAAAAPGPAAWVWPGMLAVLLAGVVVGIGLLALGPPGALPSGPKPPAAKPDAGGQDKPAPKPDGQDAADRLGDRLPPGAVVRAGTARLRQGGEVWAVAFAPDGKALASSGRDGVIHLWDRQTGRLVRPFVGHTGWVMAVAFSPDGRRLASRGGWKDQTVRLWDVATGRQLARLGTTHPGYGAIRFAPDGRTVTVNEDGAVRLWDGATGKLLRSFACPGQRVSGSAFGPDGKTLAVAANDLQLGRGPPRASQGTVSLWETATAKPLGTWRPKGAGCDALAFVPGGRTLAVATSTWGKTAVRLYDPAAHKVVRTLAEGQEQLQMLAFTPDGKTLATPGREAIRLWDVATGKELRRVPGHPVGVNVLAFSPDGKVLASGCYDSTVRLWDVAGGKRLIPTVGHEARVLSVALSPDGRVLATAGEDHLVCLWEARTGRPLRRLRGHSREAYTVSFSPDGRLLASGGWDATIRLWDPATGREVRRFAAFQGEVWFIAFSPDGRTLASGHRDGIVRLWDVATGAEQRRLTGHQGSAFGLAFSPDGRTLASAGDDRTIRLWDPATGREVRRLVPEGEGRVWCLAFSPDGRALASAGHYHKEVRVWEVASGRERCRLTGHARGVCAVAFAPGGRLLVSAGLGGTVRLWSLPEGRPWRRLSGHCGAINALAFAADGRTLASGGDDTTALLWRVGDPGRAGRPSRGTLTQRDLDSLWGELAGADAARAYRAIATLAGSPGPAAAFLRDRLRPADRLDAARLPRLLAALESEHFAVRERATRELELAGEQAEGALREALRGRAAPETRRRLEIILKKVESRTLNPEELRALRAIEALELIGGPSARTILQALSRGAPGALRTREAKASRTRLRRE